MKKILYVMHISWGWIKQRPQFIAEELAKTCEVDVYYRMSNHNKKGENPSLEAEKKELATGLSNVSRLYLWNFHIRSINGYGMPWI